MARAGFTSRGTKFLGAYLFSVEAFLKIVKAFAIFHI
jgi:hypothetical protein